MTFTKYRADYWAYRRLDSTEWFTSTKAPTAGWAEGIQLSGFALVETEMEGKRGQVVMFPSWMRL